MIHDSLILNKLFCFHCLEVRERLLVLRSAVNEYECAISLFILTDTGFDAFHWLLHKTDYFSL